MTISRRFIRELLVTPEPTRAQAAGFIGIGFAVLLSVMIHDIVTTHLSSTPMYVVSTATGMCLMSKGAGIWLRS